MSAALNAPNQAPRWSVALVGNPNCGKTALFNLLTGARQKVANYAGVTVERKVGLTRLKSGRTVQVIDLPGAYSLTPATPDEQITLEVIEGRRHGEAAPDAIVAVVDATNLRMNLRLVLELAQLGRPLMVALNMADVARAEGLAIDVDKLAGRARLPGRGDGRRPRRRPRRAARTARAAPRQRDRAEPVGRRGPCPRRGGHARGALVGRPAEGSAPHPRDRRTRGGEGAPIPASDRCRRHAPGLGPGAARRGAVPDVPGGVLVGEPADGRDQGRDGRASATGPRPTSPKGRCAACSSTASSPVPAACSCSCRRS